MIKIKSYSPLVNVNNSGSPAGARSLSRLILLIALIWTPFAELAMAWSHLRPTGTLLLGSS